MQLKRHSQEILGKMQSLNIVDFDDIDGTSPSAVDTVDVDLEIRDVFNKKISSEYRY